MSLPLTRFAPFEPVSAAVLNSYADEIERGADATFGNLTNSAVPLLRVRRTSNFTVANDAAMSASWQTADEDSDGMWDPGTPDLVTVRTPGVWLFASQTTWGTTIPTGGRGSYITLNGTDPGSTAITAHEVTSDGRSIQLLSVFRRFVAGDLLRLRVYQNSGGNLAVDAIGYGGVYLAGVFVGP